MRDGHLTIDGTVAAHHGAGRCTVQLKDGRKVHATICGRLQQRGMPRVNRGDHVEVRFSPVDLSHGQIYWRHSNAQGVSRNNVAS